MSRQEEELARIADIKSERNLREEESLREVYDTLVESEEFETPVGIGFLREAQKRLVKNPEQRKTMKAIPFHAVVREVYVIMAWLNQPMWTQRWRQCLTLKK